jgi:glycosyltransferase involved in cell wall biosynthesis
MKICLFADARSVHIRQLSLHLARRGHQVHVITHKPAQLSGATVEKFSIPPPGFSNPCRWASRRRRYLSDILRKFDVINVHFLADWGLTELLPDRESGDARLVATAWGSDVVDPPGEAPATAELTIAREGLLRAADAITTCGPTFAETVAQYASIPVISICVVPFGVDLSLFKPDAGKPEECNVARVGFFKGFRAVYGPTILVQAIPAVLAQCPHARFEMIGDGAELEICQTMARELGVDHAVEWVGRMDHSLLPDRLRRWQLSVIPSIHEAFGVAALESQAMSVPVVASRVDGLNDTVRDGETGLLIPVGDSDALAGAVVRLLQDSDRRRQMGLSGQEMVARHYRWDEVADQWVGLFSRVREQACVMV